MRLKDYSIGMTRWDDLPFTLLGILLSAGSAFIFALVVSELLGWGVALLAGILYFAVMYRFTVLEVVKCD